MKPSEKIRNFIKAREGLRLTAYRCPSSVVTVGYGHTGLYGAKEGMRITPQQAEELFTADLDALEAPLNRHLTERRIRLSQHQYDALVSFTFNVGLGNFLASTLWRKLCADPKDPTIPAEFRRWVYGNGKKLPGLVTRRRQEAQIYQYGKADGYE